MRAHIGDYSTGINWTFIYLDLDQDIYSNIDFTFKLILRHLYFDATNKSILSHFCYKIIYFVMFQSSKILINIDWAHHYFGSIGSLCCINETNC